MYIDPTQTAPAQSMHFDKFADFAVIHERRLRERVEVGQYLASPRKRAAREFTDYKRMRPDVIPLQQLRESRALAAKVIDPNGRID